MIGIERSHSTERVDTGAVSGPRSSADAIQLGGLAGLGLASALLYALGIAARYPLVAGLALPRAGWYRVSGGSLQAGLMHAGVYALLMLCYVGALRLLPGLSTSTWRTTITVIVAGWLLSSIALLGTYPGESLDIFDYLFRGRMLAEFGASPLAVAPAVFGDQPLYDRITWRGQVDTYGPLWEYASGAVAWSVHRLAGRTDSLIAYILGYRALALALAGVCGVLVAAIVGRYAPPLVPVALLAWLWNPLLLITTAVGAHNDILMIAALLAALLLFQRRRWVWGWLGLALAAHVKLTALLLLPVLGLWLILRCGWRRALWASALALALAIPLSWLLYAPLGGWATLPRMLGERARFLVNSPANQLYRLLQERWGWAEVDAWRATTQGATVLFFVLAGAFLLWFWWHYRRLGIEKADALLWYGSMVLTLLYLLVGSFWFEHWYLLWALAPAALLPTGRWARTLVPAYCLGALWSDLANSFLTVLPGRPLSATQVGAINVLAQTLPLLAVIVLPLLWSWMSKLLMSSSSRHMHMMKNG
jgi:ALG3 protein